MTGQAIRGAVGLLVAAFSWTACDGAEADPTIAKAMETKSEMQVAAAAVADRKHAEAKATKDAADQLEQTRIAEITAAAKLPAKLPAKLDDACDELVESFDTFMLAGSEKDVLQWWDGHRKKLGQRRSKCMQQSIAVAACSAHALRAELPSLKGVPRREAARRVVEACIDSFGNDA